MATAAVIVVERFEQRTVRPYAQVDQLVSTYAACSLCLRLLKVCKEVRREGHPDTAGHGEGEACFLRTILQRNLMCGKEGMHLHGIKYVHGVTAICAVF